MKPVAVPTNTSTSASNEVRYDISQTSHVATSVTADPVSLSRVAIRVAKAVMSMISAVRDGAGDRPCGRCSNRRNASAEERPDLAKFEQISVEAPRKCRRLWILAVTGDLKYGKRKQSKEADRGEVFR